MGQGHRPPIYNAIVWQCRRTADIVDRLVNDGLEQHIRSVTGLIPDAYFSATKIKWILDHVEGAREKAARGEVLFGTVDSWLLWKLTGGAVHVTDYTNASRTMLFTTSTLWTGTTPCFRPWTSPRSMLPEVRGCSEIYGYTDIQGRPGAHRGHRWGPAGRPLRPDLLPPGEAKNTYGTGCFLLMNTGDTPASARTAW